jgi:hypothetical protein
MKYVRSGRLQGADGPAEAGRYVLHVERGAMRRRAEWWLRGGERRERSDETSVNTGRVRGGRHQELRDDQCRFEAPDPVADDAVERVILVRTCRPIPAVGSRVVNHERAQAGGVVTVVLVRLQRRSAERRQRHEHQRGQRAGP